MNTMEASSKTVFIKPQDVHGILNRDQMRVINVLRGQARHESDGARELFSRLLAPHVDRDDMDNTIHRIQEYIGNVAPIIIHFSPHLVEKFTQDGVYRNIFEVDIGVKGEGYRVSRRTWESACFLKLYDAADDTSRPKYGALNFLNNPAGIPSANSYGSCYFELQDAVRIRTTLANGDTAGTSTIGVLAYCMHILRFLTAGEIMDLIKIVTGKIPHSKAYDNIYREIQIHGDIRFDRDIKCMHVDEPSWNLYREKIEAFASRYGFPVKVFKVEGVKK